MSKPSFFVFLPFYLFLSFLMSALLAACEGGGETGVTPPATGAVTTTISDPPTCLVPNGAFQGIWVTITRVQAHISSSAGPNDSGWVDLADLRKNPAQIDLLSLSSPDCLPTPLGSSSAIPPGQYQQIRLYLLSNSPEPGEAVPSPNVCGGPGFNCVVMADGTARILLVSGEAETGIQIPPGQISGGSFSVSAGQFIIVNIDFDACSSLVLQGNGQFRLKPVLHAGEISLAGNSISGAVVDYSTKAPIPNAIVAVEQPDPDNPNIDRVISQTTTGPAGSFIICPLPSGNYDVVAAAQTVFTTYNATATLEVPLGTALGNIPLIPEIGILPATVNGQISTTNSEGIATAADLNVSALQPAGSLLVTIPPLESSTPNVASDSGLTIYRLVLPASNPLVGVFSLSPPTAYAPPNAGPAVYQVNARAFIPMSFGLNPGSPDCDPSSLPSSFNAGTLLLLGPGATATQDFAFTGCQ
jgi:hypothetical protein